MHSSIYITLPVHTKYFICECIVQYASRYLFTQSAPSLQFQPRIRRWRHVNRYEIDRVRIKRRQKGDDLIDFRMFRYCHGSIGYWWRQSDDAGFLVDVSDFRSKCAVSLLMENAVRRVRPGKTDDWVLTPSQAWRLYRATAKTEPFCSTPQGNYGGNTAKIWPLSRQLHWFDHASSSYTLQNHSPHV